MDYLGRYYTNEAISKLLISKFKQNSPNNVLELGVGHGSLLKCAIKRWKKAKYVVTDIDKKSKDFVSKKIPSINFFKVNGLYSDLASKINVKLGSMDVAICNPPYKRLKNNERIKKILKYANLIESSKLKSITTDIIFLAQNILLLKEGGELGIILPDSIITGDGFSAVRKDLIENYKINIVIQLPDRVFKKTEARTHILIIEKSGKNNECIPITISDYSGNLENPIKSSIKDCYCRMDYNYHIWNYKSTTNKQLVSLNDINADIKRGTFTEKALKESGINYFHTNSFSKKNTCSNFKQSKCKSGNIAKKGDILLARVGKRCIGRITKVNSGQITISDCILKIRVPSKYRMQLWKTLKSKSGQEWLKAHAHGVCAQVISKRDLLNFIF